MAISSLITPPTAKVGTSGTAPHFTPAECAYSFVSNLEQGQRVKFKNMIKKGIKCGYAIAKRYGVPVDEFMQEVEAII